MIKKCHESSLALQTFNNPPLTFSETTEESISFWLSQVEEYLFYFKIIKTNSAFTSRTRNNHSKAASTISGLNVISKQIILESRELINDSETEDTKSPQPLEFLRNRAKFLYSSYTERFYSSKSGSSRPRSPI